jgi:hypothetical protein
MPRTFDYSGYGWTQEDEDNMDDHDQEIEYLTRKIAEADGYQTCLGCGDYYLPAELDEFGMCAACGAIADAEDAQDAEDAIMWQNGAPLAGSHLMGYHRVAHIGYIICINCGGMGFGCPICHGAGEVKF